MKTVYLSARLRPARIIAATAAAAAVVTAMLTACGHAGTPASADDGSSLYIAPVHSTTAPDGDEWCTWKAQDGNTGQFPCPRPGQPLMCAQTMHNTANGMDGKVSLGPCDMLAAEKRLGRDPRTICQVDNPKQQLPADAKDWCFGGHWPGEPADTTTTRRFEDGD